ncbi:hypothetical protein CAPTEDRAFT_199332 [Capitella teleta]|uniref:Uncharacterized protein n=1 Tax=Capitella teleta TaxID=283909 RepID=R7TTN3_CAPTE|nr:hypothetical protein CAPTEDRAFT_199332 [Capitella teleta]|eukprot:ELT97273.1 hypothetical protein CAPTEDRAFT_199332 [Capitella teleta]
MMHVRQSQQSLMDRYQEPLSKLVHMHSRCIFQPDGKDQSIQVAVGVPILPPPIDPASIPDVLLIEDFVDPLTPRMPMELDNRQEGVDQKTPYPNKYSIFDHMKEVAEEEHIIPVLERLHWPSLAQRIEYRIAVLVLSVSVPHRRLVLQHAINVSGYPTALLSIGEAPGDFVRKMISRYPNIRVYLTHYSPGFSVQAEFGFVENGEMSTIHGNLERKRTTPHYGQKR